jgi:hypothetical protein
LWVWLVAGCGRLGFDPSSIELPPTDAITIFPGPRADPTLLPVATGQIEGLAPAQSLAANGSFVDPVSGVRVWKLTDATFPIANINCRSDREHAGAQISAAWNDDHHTISFVIQDGVVNDQRFLVDFQRGVGFSNSRKLVVQGGEDLFAFTTDPVNPQVAFAGDGLGRLHLLDTATNTKVESTTFPLQEVFTLPSVSAGGRVIAAQSTNTGFIALDTATGQRFTLVTGGDNVPVVDHAGRFVTQAVSDASQLWKIGEPTSSSWQPPTGDFQASTGVSGGFVAVDVDSGGGDMKIYFSDPEQQTHVQIGNYGGYDTVSLASQWIQTDVPALEQWLLYTTAEQGFPGATKLDDAIGFFRLDGEFRFLAHHYTDDSPTFYKQPRASMSPDGRLVVFTSTMGTDRTDVYVAEVPLSP